MAQNPTALRRTALEKEITALANRIDAWWQTQMAADSKLLRGDLFRRYPDLGSDSKFGKFLKGDFSDTATTLEDWHHNYSVVWNQISDIGNVVDTPDGRALLNSLSGITKVRKAIISLTSVNTTRRVLHVTGETGTGKSCIAASLQAKWGSRVVIVEVTNVWKDKSNRLLGAICEAVGMNPGGLPCSGSDKLTRIVAHLKATRTWLVLEEAHHMGPEMMDTMKTLVNKTPGEFVFISIPTLMRRLQQAAYEQARQLFASHRLFGTIKLALTAGDAARLLEDYLGEFDDMRAASAWLVEPTRAPRHGNLGFIRDVAEQLLAERKRTSDTDPITAVAIQNAATAVINER